jgi:hypothetical protein
MPACLPSTSCVAWHDVWLVCVCVRAQETNLSNISEFADDVIRLLRHCESAGISDWVQFDASVVRGLSYYTGIVFEGHDRKVCVCMCVSNSVPVVCSIAHCCANFMQ